MTVRIHTQTGTKRADRVIVKANGWIKYETDGRISHYPPSEVESIHEDDPDEKSGRHGSDVIYQSPHGRV